MNVIKSFIAVLFCGTTLLTQPSCLEESYSVKISGPVTLDEKWVEFNPKPYLKPDKDWQEIGLELEQPFNDDFFKKGKGPDKGKGILMPDGDVINPEIEVMDQYGNVFKLVYTGAIGVGGNGKGGKVTYANPYPQKFPRDREYKAVRIRSLRPIKCKAIYWLCESAKDLQ
jgi:hypothetical protein